MTCVAGTFACTTHKVRDVSTQTIKLRHDASEAPVRLPQQGEQHTWRAADASKGVWMGIRATVLRNSERQDTIRLWSWWNSPLMKVTDPRTSSLKIQPWNVRYTCTVCRLMTRIARNRSLAERKHVPNGRAVVWVRCRHYVLPALKARRGAPRTGHQHPEPSTSRRRGFTFVTPISCINLSLLQQCD